MSWRRFFSTDSSKCKELSWQYNWATEGKQERQSGWGRGSKGRVEEDGVRALKAVVRIFEKFVKDVESHGRVLSMSMT